MTLVFGSDQDRHKKRWKYGMVQPKRYGRFLIATGLACSISMSADADVIQMLNGDVLNGELVRLDTGTLKFKTAYAGIINISWSHVAALTSSKVLWITLVGENIALERTVDSARGIITITDLEGKQRNFSNVWPIAAIDTQRPVLANQWVLGGEIAALLDNQMGDDDELVISVDGRITLEDAWNKNTLYWEGELERDSGISSHDWHVGYAYSRYLDEHWFVQGNIEQQHDSDTALWQQTTLGGMLGYRFWETATQRLSISTGLSRLWDDYQEQASEQYFALTSIVNYKTPIMENWSYYINTRTFVRIGHSSTQSTVAQGIKIGLTDHLVWSLSHLFEYDKNEDDSDEPVDMQLKVGLGYQW